MTDVGRRAPPTEYLSRRIVTRAAPPRPCCDGAAARSDPRARRSSSRSACSPPRPARFSWKLARWRYSAMPLPCVSWKPAIERRTVDVSCCSVARRAQWHVVGAVRSRHAKCDSRRRRRRHLQFVGEIRIRRKASPMRDDSGVVHSAQVPCRSQRPSSATPSAVLRRSH